MVTEQTLSKRQTLLQHICGLHSYDRGGKQRHKGIKWLVKGHMTPCDRCLGKKRGYTHVCAPWDVSLAGHSPLPCLFCSAPSQDHFLFWLPTTGFFPFPLFFVFHNLCKAQLMHSKAMTEQESHDVECKEARWFHLTPHMTVKCCCCFASESVNHHCGLDDNLRDINHTKEERWKI